MRISKTFVFFFYIIFCSLVQDVAAESTVKYYEPIQEELTGVIKSLTFPGPPNYEDIKKGDRKERCPYLILDSPVDVTTKRSISVDSQLPFDDETHIQLIQLAVSKKAHWVLMKDGVRVKVRGELYEAHTGHHHTRVLMYISDVKLHSCKGTASFKNAQIVCESDNGFCEVECVKKV